VRSNVAHDLAAARPAAADQPVVGLPRSAFHTGSHGENSLKSRRIDLPLALLMVISSAACNLSSTPVVTPPSPSPAATTSLNMTATVDPGAMGGPTKTAVATPEDFTKFPSVSWIGRLSLAQGWVLVDGRLLWTDDGGESWSDITPAGLSNCPKPDECYIASPPVSLSPAHVRISVVRGREASPPTTLDFMFTENGGRTWGLQPIAEFADSLVCPGPACISGAELAFPDTLHGWLAAHAPLGMSSDVKYLYRTLDGGQTWSSLEMPAVGLVVFVDDSIGWAVGGVSHWTSELLFRTPDGGIHWQPVDLTSPVAYAGAAHDYHTPVFFSDQVGVLPVNFFRSEPGGRQGLGFYTTQDDGKLWSYAGAIEDPLLDDSSRGSLTTFSAIDDSNWYVFVNSARQYLTHDRGQTWEVFQADGLGDATLIDVQFASAAEGWGLGLTCDKNTGCTQPMFATHDGGHTWTPIAPAP
jgi:photosystem II stability/assembly factor-like uncharacterized protein